MNGNEFVDTDAENVVVTSGEVTAISSTPASEDSGDAVAADGEAITASLSPDGKVLNLAFIDRAGHAQIIQVRVTVLTRAREAARAGEVGTEAHAGSDDVVVSTRQRSGDRSQRRRRNLVCRVSVAAELGDQGQLSQTFVDCNGDAARRDERRGARRVGPSRAAAS